jgi:hypothetical protein
MPYYYASISIASVTHILSSYRDLLVFLTLTVILTLSLTLFLHPPLNVILCGAAVS